MAGRGLEPLTSRLWASRATNCSTPRQLHVLFILRGLLAFGAYAANDLFQLFCPLPTELIHHLIRQPAGSYEEHYPRISEKGKGSKGDFKIDSDFWFIKVYITEIIPQPICLENLSYYTIVQKTMETTPVQPNEKGLSTGSASTSLFPLYIPCPARR